ncbi:MAG: hypothetical protein PVSMB7_22080 [Chloroflexota bacterium]
MQQIFAGPVLRRTAVLVLLAAALSACSVSSAAHTPTVTPVPADTPTPTPGVTFVVAVSPAPTARPTRTPAPPPRAATATPDAPYLALSPSSGPPVARTIRVIGANLEPSATVQLVWSPEGRFSPVQTTAYTNGHGRLDARFHVPGSPPGPYRVMAQINGASVASARYLVASHANLRVSVQGSPHGETVSVDGRRFLPGLHLVLVAYPLFRGAKVVVLTRVSTDSHGTFSVQQTSRILVPGQYVLRSFSTDAVSAQMAEQFFEVVS